VTILILLSTSTWTRDHYVRSWAQLKTVVVSLYLSAAWFKLISFISAVILSRCNQSLLYSRASCCNLVCFPGDLLSTGHVVAPEWKQVKGKDTSIHIHFLIQSLELLERFYVIKNQRIFWLQVRCLYTLVSEHPLHADVLCQASHDK